MMKRRSLLLAGPALLTLNTLKATAMPLASAAVPNLQEASATTLAQAMQAGRTTAAALVQAYGARITAIDQRGPRLNSIIERNPDALAIAKERDAERRAGKLRGPLHGKPVLLKDNIATADKMQTTAGSLALMDARPPRDAMT